MHPFPDRLTALRAELARQGVDGCLVPRADEHLGEYVPPSAARLAWLTGFTGVGRARRGAGDQAALFTDGRYVTQAAAQTDPALWEAGTSPGAAARLAPGNRAGRRGSATTPGCSARRRWPATVTPGSRSWRWSVTRSMRPGPTGRRRPLARPPHPLALAGDDAAEKRAEIAGALREAEQDAAVITDPASIAWLLNLRGEDVAFTPVALGFALMRADATATLFMAPGKLPAETRAWLGNAVACGPRAALPEALAALRGQGSGSIRRAAPPGSRSRCARPVRSWPRAGPVPAAQGVQEHG